MTTDARRTLGQLGEDLAAAHLERLGFTVLDRNFRTRFGELDVVAFDGDVLAFCEVKTRRAAALGHPWDSLGPTKQRQVRRMAAIWLKARRDRPFFPALRFDAIGIVVDAAGALVSLEHLEGAF